MPHRSELMASSSSCSDTSEAKHQVFLSFRGEDTRDNFTSHLYAALCHKKIEAFIDNDLHRGDEISESLMKAIEESKIAIIIFSKGYATSRWCLEELVKILECKKSLDLIAIPVFYHVDPSDVRNQTGLFREAFVNHEQRFEQRLEKVQRWRDALTEAANLSGFDSNVIRPEAVLIEEIVKNILKMLNHLSPIDKTDLIGVESSIKDIELLLRMESKDVFIVGIWGMGGIGKTTLAHAVFTKMSSQFESVYFQNNVREKLEKFGLIHLTREFLFAILEDECAILESAFTKNRLRHKKIFVVFDDVTCSKQIKGLIGNLESFGPGSRIIITTRDKQVLRNSGVDLDKIYKVKELRDDQALELFSQHAFKQNQPNVGYMELSKRVLRFAKGIPLALEVLGCMLFQKSEPAWESAVDNLERSSSREIQDVLKSSYDELNDEQKNIFLDIACFLKGEDRNLVMEILDANGFASEVGVNILIDKSLVIITDDDKITMHDLLQEMGKKIVTGESKNLGKRSRLWHHEDIHHVLKKNKGTEAIEGICLNMSKVKDIRLDPHTFLNMHNLRFLNFYCSSWCSCNFSDSYCTCYLFGSYYRKFFCSNCSPDEQIENKVHAFQGLEFASTDLRYLGWFGYPLKSLPSNLKENENLYALVMPHSNIEQLWNNIQHFDRLKHINLCHSKQLTRIPDLSLIPNLETLILEGCTSLIEVPSSIQYLRKLIILNLRGCRRLSILPTCFESESLTDVILSGCSNLKTALKISCNMERVHLDGTAIKELPLIESPSRLVELNLENCSSLGCLTRNIGKLKFLRHFPHFNLRNLDPDLMIDGIIDAPPLRKIPLSIVHWKKLSGLTLRQSYLGSTLPLLSGSSFSENWVLDVSNCQITRLPYNLGQLSCLIELHLSGNNFESIPASIKDLSQLEFLDISYCERLQSLPKLPSKVCKVHALNCTSLEVISDSFFRTRQFNLGNCFKLDQQMLKAKVRRVLLRLQPKVQRFVDDRYSIFRLRFGGQRYFIVPGNEIPEFFGFQNETGSSISLKLPPDCFGKNLLTFSVGVVVASQDHQKVGDSFSLSYELVSRNKHKLCYGCKKYVWNVNQVERYNLRSDHVFLVDKLSIKRPYLMGKQEVVFDGNDCCMTINFHCEGEIESWKVKKIGVMVRTKRIFRSYKNEGK